MKEYVVLGVITLFLLGCAPQEQTTDLNAFAQCLGEKGVKMYGSYICSACLATKKAFGPAFEHIEEIECHPRGPNPQTELCLTRNIQKTPAWIMEENGNEIKRLEGFQDFNDLAAFSGCPYP